MKKRSGVQKTPLHFQCNTTLESSSIRKHVPKAIVSSKNSFNHLSQRQKFPNHSMFSIRTFEKAATKKGKEHKFAVALALAPKFITRRGSGDEGSTRYKLQLQFRSEPKSADPQGSHSWVRVSRKYPSRVRKVRYIIARRCPS